MYEMVRKPLYLDPTKGNKELEVNYKRNIKKVSQHL